MSDSMGSQSANVTLSSKDPDLVAFLPYVGLTNHIRRVVSWHKDDLELNTPEVYSISCKCSQVYISQTGCLTDTRVKEHYQHIWTDTRVKEHYQHIWLDHPNKSAGCSIVST
jgi:hypothetical protein